MSQQLSDLLLQCAEALKAECVHRGSAIHLFRNRVDHVRLPGPCLIAPGQLHQLPLQDLSKVLYGAPDINVEHALRIWQMAAALLWERAQPRSVMTNLLNEAFPNLPFTVKFAEDLRVPLTSYLLACSWHFGSLRTTTKSVMLVLDDDRRIGFNKRSVEWIGGYRLTKNEIDFNPKLSLSANLGKRIKATTTTSALYRYLHSTLPDLNAVIDYIFQAAVYAGRPYEEVLAAPFDVESLRNVEMIDQKIWDDALRIVDTNFLKPYGKLFKLLVPTVMTRTTFRRTFGDRTAKSETFSHADRARYRSAILSAQAASITEVKSAAVDGDEPEQGNSEAQQLLELQRLLGGSL